MRKLLISAAAIAAVMMGGSSAFASNLCGLTQGQLDEGWKCTVTYTGSFTDTSYEQAGKSHMCKVYEQEFAYASWVATNPAGKDNPGHSGSSDEPVAVGEPEKVGGNVVCP